MYNISESTVKSVENLPENDFINKAEKFHYEKRPSVFCGPTTTTQVVLTTLRPSKSS